MLTSYSRVTIVSGTRRVDLALPSALPIADVVPQVLRFCAPEQHTTDPGEFTLARLGGQSMTLSQSLAEAGVHDGDVIELRTFSQQSRAAFVEDVRDAIEDSVNGAGGAWTSRSTVTFVILATCATVSLYASTTLLQLGYDVMGQQAEPQFSTTFVAASMVTALTVGLMTWAATVWAAPWTAYLTSVVASAWAFLAGLELASAQGSGIAPAMLTGAACAALVAGALRLQTPHAMPSLAAWVVIMLALAPVAVADLTDADQGNVVRVVAMLAVLSIGVMPRLSIAVGGLSSADYRVRNAGRMTDDALNTRIQASSGLLLGAIVGVSLVGGLIGFWLGVRNDDWSQDVWDRILSLSLAATLALRSRVFSRIQYMLPLRVAAVFVVLASVQQQAYDQEWLGSWVVPGIAVVGLAALGVSVLRVSDVSRARVKRLLNVVEFIVVVDLIVVTMGAVTLYDVIRKE